MALTKTDISTVLETLLEASNAITHFYKTGFETNVKADGSYVTNADLKSSKIILKGLEAFGWPIMCEEELIPPYEIRQDWKRFWSVDPLDGTKGFVRKTGEFAINIALIENGTPIAGFIANPLEGKVIYSIADKGVYVHEMHDNETDIEVSGAKIISNEPNVVSWIKSHSVQTDLETLIKSMLPAETQLVGVSKGSALKFFDLALGKADVYPRLLPSMEWDIAAGHAILKELNGEIIDLSTNQELSYNKKSLFNSNFIAKTPRFASKELVLNN